MNTFLLPLLEAKGNFHLSLLRDPVNEFRKVKLMKVWVSLSDDQVSLKSSSYRLSYNKPLEALQLQVRFSYLSTGS